VLFRLESERLFGRLAPQATEIEPMTGIQGQEAAYLPQGSMAESLGLAS
jgi:hypothetical protein